MTKLKPRYAAIVEQEFKRRQARNSRYSMRAFARDLGVAQSTVSSMIRGQTGLSKKKAQVLAKKLNLTNEDYDYFVELVVADCSKSLKVRREAELRLRQYASQFNTVTIDFGRIISDWQSVSAIELIQIHGKKATEEFLAKALNQSKTVMAQVVQNLRVHKILEGYKIHSDFLVFASGVKNEWIYKFQRDMLQKAADSILDQNIELKAAGTSVVKMRKSDFPWLAKEFRQFRRKISARLEEGTGHDAVFCISTPIFRLDRDV